MAAATADRQTPATRITGSGKLALATSAEIFNGTMVASNASGLGAAASNAASIVVMGRADEYVDEAAGDDYVEYSTGRFWFANSGTNPVDVADIGRPCFVEDDQTVADRPGTLGVVAGIVKDVDSTLGVLVEIESNNPQSFGGYTVAAITSGAIPLARRQKLSVTGTVAFTLADGTFVGQQIVLNCTVAASVPVGVVTPATADGFTTITFDAVQEFAILEWNGASWSIMATNATVA